MPQKILRILLCTVLLASGLSVAQPSQHNAADEISVGNIGGMTLRLALPTGQHGGHAGAPMVDGDRLFVVTPFPHSVLAVDLAHTDVPVLWRYTPHADGMAAGLTSTDITTGGIAVSSGRVFLNTFDGRRHRPSCAPGMQSSGRGQTISPLVCSRATPPPSHQPCAARRR